MPLLYYDPQWSQGKRAMAFREDWRSFVDNLRKKWEIVYLGQTSASVWARKWERRLKSGLAQIRRWGWFKPLMAVLGLITVYLLYVLLPWAEWFSLEYWAETGGPKSTSRSEALRNVGLLAVGVFGLGFGIWRAWTAHRQAHVAEQGLFTERFSTAVEHLGSEQLPVRLGGIYALWRLTEDSPKRDVVSVIDILCAFVRNPPHASADPPLEEIVWEERRNGDIGEVLQDVVVPMRPDVEAIVNLISDEQANFRDSLPPGYRLGLAGSTLRSANLSNANLAEANLSNANLSKAHLSNADLSDADLRSTDLSEAYLAGAILLRANLRSANLDNANLINANLFNANLRGASLVGTDLMNAVLDGANLTGSDLTSATLGVTGITTPAQIHGAVFDPHFPPKIPPELNFPDPREHDEAEAELPPPEN
jgi:hypothetical protein